MSDKKGTVLIYYLTFFVAPLAGMVQMKVFSLYLPLEEYGQIHLIIPIIGWGVLIAGFGGPQYFLRYSSTLENKGFYKLILSGLMVNIIILTLILSCYLIMREEIFFSELTYQLLITAFIAIFSGQLIALYKAYFRSSRHHGNYSAFIISERIFSSIFIVLFVLYLPFNIQINYLIGYASGALVALLVFMALGIGLILKIRSFNLSFLSSAISYGGPLALGMIFSNLLGTINRYIIGLFGSLQEVAIFSVNAMIIGIIFTTLYEPLMTYLHPIFFKLWNEGDVKQVKVLLNTYFNIYILLSGMAAIVILRHYEFIIFFLASAEYVYDQLLIFYLMMSSILYGLYRFSSIFFYIKAETMKQLYIFIISSVVSVSVTIALWSSFKLISAGIGTLTGMTILLVWTYFLAPKELRPAVNVYALIHIAVFLLILTVFPVVPTDNPFMIENIIDLVMVSLLSLAIMCSYIIVLPKIQSRIQG